MCSKKYLKIANKGTIIFINNDYFGNKNKKLK